MMRLQLSSSSCPSERFVWDRLVTFCHFDASAAAARAGASGHGDGTNGHNVFIAVFASAVVGILADDARAEEEEERRRGVLFKRQSRNELLFPLSNFRMEEGGEESLWLVHLLPLRAGGGRPPRCI